MRAICAATLCLLLAGCFSSNGPVFAEDRGQCPFTTPTLYDEVDRNSDIPPARFRFETEGAYCKVTNPEGEVTLALFGRADATAGSCRVMKSGRATSSCAAAAIG